MSQQIDAIFENGVLRPLEPLHLPDQMRVKVIVDATPNGESEEDSSGDAWTAGIARDWAAELGDARQDIYTMEDGDAVDSPA